MIDGNTVAALCASVHADNVAAGWWTDLDTGASLIGKRNVGELLMLVVTELSEADLGLCQHLPDDKLPHRRMFEVELADAAIRIFDIGGGLRLPLGEVVNRLTTKAPLEFLDPDIRSKRTASRLKLLDLVNCVSAAMEGYRKDTRTPGGVSVIADELAKALFLIFALNDALDLDVMGAIAEKRAFNATRADHKPENRRADGGKKV